MMNATTANTTAASFVATRQGATTVVADQDIILMATSGHAKVIMYRQIPLLSLNVSIDPQNIYLKKKISYVKVAYFYFGQSLLPISPRRFAWKSVDTP